MTMLTDSPRPAHDGEPVPTRIPVLIVGGGPVGLLTSLLLSRFGVDNLVIERHSQVNALPRARGITNRSVEILTQAGLGEKLRLGSLPSTWARQFVYTVSMKGELVGTMSGDMEPSTSEPFSPVTYRIAAQDRVDPMLYEAAREAGRDVVFDLELIDVEQRADAVEAVLRSADGELHRVIADYLVAADGGQSPTRALLGVKQSYEHSYGTFVAAHFRADLSAYTQGREGALIWSLGRGHEGVFHPLDGRLAWSAQIQYDPEIDDPATWDADEVVRRVRGMIGVEPDEAVDIELLKFYPFTLTTAVSDSFRQGRALLVGDSAQRTLPHGGFGLNTGIQSAHNLAWKLAAVLRGEAGEALLDTYDAERREVALRNCDFARTNAGYIAEMMRVLRTAPTLEEQRAVVNASRQYGNWRGLDLGMHYAAELGAAAIVPDDAPIPEVADPIIDYVPHAKPGWRAPHMWVRHRQSTLRASLVDICVDRLTVLAGREGGAWRAAAAAAGISLDIAVISFLVGHDGDLVPEAGDFEELYGITPTGAVLVRPDGHVAFRASDDRDASARLLDALRIVLARPDSTR